MQIETGINRLRNVTLLKPIFSKIDQLKDKLTREEIYLKMPRVTLYSGTPTTMVLSNRSNPNNCALFVNDNEVQNDSSLIIFPDVTHCMILVGRKGTTNFLFHLSPLTVTDGQENEIIKLINAVKSIKGDEGKVEIYHVNRNENDKTVPDEVTMVSKLFGKSEIKVTIKQLDSRLLNKSFAYDLSEKILKIVNNKEQIIFRKRIGKFLDKAIGTIE